MKCRDFGPNRVGKLWEKEIFETRFKCAKRIWWRGRENTRIGAEVRGGGEGMEKRGERDGEVEIELIWFRPCLPFTQESRSGNKRWRKTIASRAGRHASFAAVIIPHIPPSGLFTRAPIQIHRSIEIFLILLEDKRQRRKKKASFYLYDNYYTYIGRYCFSPFSNNCISN